MRKLIDILFSKYQNILSFSKYGHTALFLIEQDRVPIFFFLYVIILCKLIDIKPKQITDFFGYSYISIYWLLFLSKFQKARASKAKTDQFASEENLQNLLRRKKVRNSLSFSNYGHSVLFLTEQDTLCFLLNVPYFYVL